MSITVRSNIKIVSERIKEKLQILKDREYLLRPVAFDMIDLMTKRIHVDGKDAEGNEIGAYSNRYLELRQRKYNRTSDTKIIVSLTRQLENDWSVIATDKGYGVGFLNVFNNQKARWVEENKGKKIFFLSESEQKYAIERINELVSDALNT
jgi:hypothetical protein